MFIFSLRLIYPEMPFKFGSLNYKPVLYSTLAELSSTKAEIIGMNIAVSFKLNPYLPNHPVSFWESVHKLSSSIDFGAGLQGIENSWVYADLSQAFVGIAA
jgi:hypothetical protein